MLIATKLGEVLTNLLENSIRFMENGGTIKVTTDKDEKGFAVVTVRDEGTGIDSEFSRDYSRNLQPKRVRDLGLYISKAYVEAHGGKIQRKTMLARIRARRSLSRFPS